MIKVISRYLGMFSLDMNAVTSKITCVHSYFPLSWDVLIRFYRLILL